MESIVSSFVQVNIYLSLFFLVYLFFLRQDAFFQRNRFYLLGATLLSLSIPFITIPDFASEQAVRVIEQGNLEAVIVWSETGTAGVEATSWGWKESILLIYAIGAIVMFSRFAYAFLSILYLVYTHGIKREKGVWVVELNKDWQPFSFFHLLFWSAQEDMVEEEKEQIWQHELAHIKQWHSADILLFELLGILFWFNPVCWMYKQAIRQTHEFLADRAVAGHHTDKSAYSTLLLGQFLEVRQLHLSNHFMNKNFLKQRIMMLNQSNTQKSTTYKLLLALPIVLACFFIQACSARVLEPSNTANFKKVKTFTLDGKQTKASYTCVLSKNTLYRFQFNPEQAGDLQNIGWSLKLQNKEEGGSPEEIVTWKEGEKGLSEFTFEAKETGIYYLAFEATKGSVLKGEMDLSFFRKEDAKPKDVQQPKSEKVKDIEMKDGETFLVETKPNQIMTMQIVGEASVEKPAEGWQVTLYDEDGNLKASNVYEGRYFTNFSYKCKDAKTMKFSVAKIGNAVPKSRLTVTIKTYD